MHLEAVSSNRRAPSEFRCSSSSSSGSKRRQLDSFEISNQQPQASEWEWERVTDDIIYSQHASLSECRRDVTFHKTYSTGTGIVRGNKPLLADHHYFWEIQILTDLYGTDVMIGVGSQNINFSNALHRFTSFLGSDSESYGFSYTGKIQHEGVMQQYSSRFDRGTVIGVHLDMWHGTLEFYVDRKPQGIAFKGLKKHTILYPMVCSTASQSSIRLVYSVSRPASLVFYCTKSLAKNFKAIEIMKSIPGLKNYIEKNFWMISLASNNYDDSSDDECYPYFKNSNVKKSSMVFFKSTSETYLKRSSQTKDYTNPDSNNQLYEDIDNGNKKSNIEILRKIHSSGVNNENFEVDDDLWDTALEPTSNNNHQNNCNLSEEEDIIRISSSLTTRTCEVCHSRVAMSIKNSKSCIKKCLECFLYLMIYNTYL